MFSLILSHFSNVLFPFFEIIMQLDRFPFPFLPANSPIYPSLLSFKTIAFLVVSVVACAYVHTYIPKCVSFSRYYCLVDLSVNLAG